MEKKFILDGIRDNKWLSSFEFWEGVINLMIEREIQKNDEINKDNKDEKERQEKERQETERLEKERLETERREKMRREKEEKERKEKEEKEKREKEKKYLDYLEKSNTKISDEIPSRLNTKEE